MPTYAYRAKRGPRESLEGLLEADSRPQAVEILAGQGLFPLRLTEFESRGRRRWLFVKDISGKELADVTRQLGDLLESNVPLLRALDLLREQTTNPAMAHVLQSIGEQVRGGKPFSEALQAFPDHFSKLYISLVYAGETGGMFAASMGRLAAFMEQEEEFKSRIAAALAYPGFVMLVGGITIVFLMLFVVPRLAAMFSETGQGMPLIAQALSWTSRTLRSIQGAAFVSLPIVAAVWVLWRFPEKAKAFSANVLFRIPIWGPVVQKGMLARFTKTLAMLLAGGVPILQALSVVAHVLDHPAYHGQIKRVMDDVEQGSSLSESLKSTGLFPVFVCQMLAIGEEANQVEKSLEKVAASYERETDRAMKLATSLLEPMMIVGVGSVIGVIVIGMLLPIFQISTFVK